MDSPLTEVANVLADVAGTNPATGAYRYYMADHLGSTRGLYDGGKSALGGYEYTPYGEVYASSGSVALDGLAAAFTGKPWDAAAQMYYFPYRWYSPSAARWIARDPLGMVDGPNVYGYVGAMPTQAKDPLGGSLVAGLIGGCVIGILREALGGLTGADVTGRKLGCACLGGAISGFGKGWLSPVTDFFAGLAQCLCNGNSFQCCFDAGLSAAVVGSLGRLLGWGGTDVTNVEEKLSEFIINFLGGAGSALGGAAAEACCED